ncbi:M28 family metallopeptidase [Microbacterium soli]|uniref:Peptidase M28 domain-containing protein n=1 Tax=Microbacterium soli TaxID=446075 RepID=A0ABP7MZ97_9MICO
MTSDTQVDLSRVHRMWNAIIDAGPRGPFSDAVADLQQTIEAELDPIVDRWERHPFQITNWHGEQGTLTVEQETFVCLPAIQSPQAEHVEGTLALAGHQVVWGMRRWRRYVVVGRQEEPLAVILVRPRGQAIPEPMLPGSLGVPHVIVGAEAEAPLRRALQESLRVQLVCSASLGDREQAESLVAHLAGDPALPTVLICAHLDSVYTTAGAYDNATGAAALVGAVDIVSRLDRHGDITFVWFNAEEWSMTGSAAFASERAGEFDFVINLDGFGRTELLELWAGPEWFEVWLHGLFAQAGRDLGWSRPSDHLTALTPPPGGGDHDVFFLAGLPVAMLTHDDQEIIHSPDDDHPQEAMWTHLVQSLALLERVLPQAFTQFTDVRLAFEHSLGHEVGVAWSHDGKRRVANLSELLPVSAVPEKKEGKK